MGSVGCECWKGGEAGSDLDGENIKTRAELQTLGEGDLGKMIKPAGIHNELVTKASV